VPEDDILYVSSTGVLTGSCTKAAPCKTIQFGVDAVSGRRSWINIAPGVYADRVAIDAKTLHIVAFGAELAPAADDHWLPAIDVKGAANVVIEGIQIRGVITNQAGGSVGGVSCWSDSSGHAPVLTLDGVSLTECTPAIMSNDCALTLQDSTVTQNGGSANAAIESAGGSVTVTRSEISRNSRSGFRSTLSLLTIVQTTIDGNQGSGIISDRGVVTLEQSALLDNVFGGVFLSSCDFHFSNNIIARNGNSEGIFGGILVSGTPPSGSQGARLEFNTITANRASGTQTEAAGGVLCHQVDTPLSFTSNILYGNDVRQTVGANCAWAYSDVGPDGVSGTGNLNMAPAFVDETTSDYHLKPGSPGTDAADPAATLSTDFEGDARPAGGRSDMGADEVP